MNSVWENCAEFSEEKGVVGRDHLRGPDVNGRIILKRILWKFYVRRSNGFNWHVMECDVRLFNVVVQIQCLQA
jgi:hypothetical protein